MTKLADMHRKLLNEASMPMFPSNKLPIEPIEEDSPIIVMERWKDVNGVLTKTYMFRTLEMRNSFVRFLLNYEEDVQHSANMTIEEDSVVLRIKTKDVDKTTELDKEYARFADANYKDVVYNPSYDG